MASSDVSQNLPTSSEIAGQTGLPEKAIISLRDVFRRHPNIENVILYGSRATGNFRNSSDIDLTLDGDSVEWQEFLAIEREIDDLLLPWKVDLSLYHQIDNQELREHIDRVGICFLA